MILINYEEMDLIESLYMSFSRSERSSLAHFHIVLLYYSVVPKCCPILLHHVASLGVIPILSSTLNGIESL